MICYLFRDLYDKAPVETSVSLSDLAATAEAPVLTGHKSSVPLIMFARLKDPTGSRLIDNCEGATALVFDVDGVPCAAFEALLGSLTEHGIAHFWHTTYSHLDLTKQQANRDPGPGRYRLVFPISREIKPSEYKATRAKALAAIFPDDCRPDPKAADIVRISYLPSSHPDPHRVGEYRWGVHDGESIDIDALAVVPEAAPVEAPRKRRLGRGDLRAFLKRYKRRRSFRADVAEALKAIIEGGEFAQPGERNEVAAMVTWHLASEFPTASPESLETVFGASLSLMAETAPSGALTAEDIEDMFGRALGKVTAEAESRLLLPEDEATASLRAMWGEDRGPAEPTEILEDAAKLGLSPTAYLKNALIVRHGRQVFIRHLPQACYKAFPREDAADAALHMLSVYPSFQPFQEVGGMVSRKGLSQLTQDYGCVITGLERDMTLPSSRLDLHKQQLLISPCPLAGIAPEFDLWTSEFLRRFAGDKLETLLTWLSKYPDLSQPLPALYPEGAPNSGKSLFGASLGRMFGNGTPVDADDAFGDGQFNDAIHGNPLVWADEYFPTDRKGNPDTPGLRKFVQGRTKEIRKKYAANSALWGCHRVLITANNADALTFKYGVQLSEADVRAIEDRLIHIHTPEETAVWLRGEAAAGRLTHDYVENRTLAKHVLWLAEHHQSKSESRFWLKGDCEDLINRMVVTGETSDGILEIVTRWILNVADRPKARGGVFLHVTRSRDVHLMVIPHRISEAWGSFFPSGRRPPPTAVNKALGSLREGTMRVGEGDKRHRASIVHIDKLLSYGEQIGQDRETLLDALGRLVDAELNKH